MILNSCDRMDEVHHLDCPCIVHRVDSQTVPLYSIDLLFNLIYRFEHHCKSTFYLLMNHNQWILKYDLLDRDSKSLEVYGIGTLEVCRISLLEV